MSSSRELRDFIFRVKQVISAVEGTTGFDALDPTSKDILEFVGRAELEGRGLFVADVIRHRAFGSVANVHGRLSSLVGAGWLALEPDPSDGRRKRVVLTPTTRSAFNRISSRLETALRTEG